MTIIAVMGMIALVLLAMLGASFLGKVGGAEAIPRLRSELLAGHGSYIADQEGFTVRPLHEESSRGLLVRFEPATVLARNLPRLESRMRRMAGQIYSNPAWTRRLDFVEVVAELPEREVSRRFDAESAQELPGRLAQAAGSGLGTAAASGCN